MKKILSMILSIIAATSFLVGCGNEKSTDNSTNKNDVTLTVLTNRTDIVDTQLKEYAEKYKEKTGVTIKWEAITDYEGDVKVRLNSDNYGDVLLIPNAIKQSELEQFFEPLGKNTDSDIKEYLYNTYKAVKNKDTNDYTVYGLTYGLGVDGIVYNKAVFKKIGYNEFPKTLDEWYNASAKLAKEGVIPLAINFKDKWPLAAWDSMATPIHGKGDWWINIYKEETPFSKEKPNGQALEILYKFVSSGWVEKDLTTTNWEQSKADLGQGKIAAMILGTWAVPQVQQFASNKDDIGFAPIPVNNSGKLYAIAGPDWCMAISKKSQHKEEARKFLFDFINSDFADKQGLVPVKKGAESSNQVIKDFLNSGVTLLTYEDGQNGDEGDKKDSIAREAGIDFWGGTYIQNIALAAKKSRVEFEKVVSDLNSKWLNAKKKLGY